MRPGRLIKKYETLNLNSGDIMSIMFPTDKTEDHDFVNLMTCLMINSLSDCQCKIIANSMTPLELLTMSSDFDLIDMSKCLYCSCRKFMSKTISKKSLDVDSFFKFMEELIRLQKKNKYCSCYDDEDETCRICDLYNSLKSIKDRA